MEKKMNLTISLTLKLNNPPDLTTFTPHSSLHRSVCFSRKIPKRKEGARHGDGSDGVACYSRPNSCPEMMSSFVNLKLPGESLTHSLTPSLAH